MQDIFKQARIEYGEGFIHLLVSWLKGARILLSEDDMFDPEVLATLQDRAYLKISKNYFLSDAQRLSKEDVCVLPSVLENGCYETMAVKLVSFGSYKKGDGVILKKLDKECLVYFRQALLAFKGNFNLLQKPTPYLFLDRDGVIINYVSYPKNPAQVHLREGIVELIAKYRQLSYRVVMVTNQSGVARGYSTQDDFRQVQGRTLELLAQAGQWIDACYFATYLANSDVIQTLQYPSLRKPRTGMLAEESQFWNIDLENSVMIGDNASDVEWAQNAGLGRVFWLDNPELREKSPASMTNVTQVQSLDQILKLI